MSANTKIEWADHTFNPWIGCTKVGPGCDNCYAEADFDKRRKVVQWGAGQPRKRTAPSTWAQPLKWNAEAGRDMKAWEEFKAVNEFGDADLISRGMVKPKRPRVFCASLADVFDNEVPTQWRIELIKLILATPHLDWLLLTKRIGNAADMLEVSFRAAHAQREGWRDNVPPNVWIGATIANQVEAGRDIPKLLAVPAAKRFLSMEPLLGPVDLSVVACLPCPTLANGLIMDPSTGGYDCCKECDWTGLSSEWGIDWVIVGGESGPKARPMHPDWARSLRDQCQAAGVPFLFKQWGNWRPAAWFDGPDSELDDGDDFLDLERSKHEFLANDGRSWDTNGGRFMYPPLPLGHWCLMVNEGKKAAGRMLDGRLWDEVPQ